MAFDNMTVISSNTYSTNTIMLAQQMVSKVRPYVNIVKNKGEFYFFNLYGKAVAQEVTERLADFPLADSNYSRVGVAARPYAINQGVDKFDALNTNLNDPLNPIAKAQAAAMSRQIDSIILNAAVGTALTGQGGTTSTALPAGQIIPSTFIGDSSLTPGAQGMNIFKILRAQKIMDDQGVASEGRAMALTPRAREQLLSTNEVVNNLYGISREQVAALRIGEVEQIAGFDMTIVVPELVPVNGSGERQIVAWQRDSMGLVINEDASSSTIWIDHRKLGSPIAYTTMMMGATRLDPAGVVSIACTE
jgi:hypothetical protein